MTDWIESYIAAQTAALQSIPAAELDAWITLLRRAVDEDRQIFVCGNGGSASNASHFLTDLAKCSSEAIQKNFRIFGLSDCTSWITALGNDYAYDEIFLRQLRQYARPGDILLQLSVSGSSPNLVKACEWARENRLTTLAITGGKGGRLAELADRVIRIDTPHYGRAEDAQMTVCHMLCYAFVEHPETAGLSTAAR